MRALAVALLVALPVLAGCAAPTPPTPDAGSTRGTGATTDGGTAPVDPVGTLVVRAQLAGEVAPAGKEFPVSVALEGPKDRAHGIRVLLARSEAVLRGEAQGTTVLAGGPKEANVPGEVTVQARAPISGRWWAQVRAQGLEGPEQRSDIFAVDVPPPTASGDLAAVDNGTTSFLLVEDRVQTDALLAGDFGPACPRADWGLKPVALAWRPERDRGTPPGLVVRHFHAPQPGPNATAGMVSDASLRDNSVELRSPYDANQVLVTLGLLADGTATVDGWPLAPGQNVARTFTYTVPVDPAFGTFALVEETLTIWHLGRLTPQLEAPAPCVG